MCYIIAACFPFEPLEKCMTFKDIFAGLSRTLSFNFQDFPGPKWFSRTFQVLEFSRKKSRTFQEAWEPCTGGGGRSLWVMLQRCLTAETLEVSAMCCTHRSTRHCTKLVNKYTQQLNKRRLHRSPNAIRPAVWVRLNQHLTDKYHSQTHDASYYYYYYYPTSQKNSTFDSCS